MESKTNAPSFTVSLRGYDRMEVDEYLDSLAEALGQVEEAEDRNRAMQAHVDRLNARIADLEEKIGNDVPRTGAVLAERIAILLRSAEETAADTIGRAEAAAAAMLDKAHEEVASAEDQARGAIARGDEQARRIEAAARAEAAEIVAEAEARASARTRQIEQWAEQVISHTRAEEARLLAEQKEQRERAESELKDRKEKAEAELQALADQRDAVAETIAGLRESLGQALGLVGTAGGALPEAVGQGLVTAGGEGPAAGEGDAGTDRNGDQAPASVVGESATPTEAEAEAADETAGDSHDPSCEPPQAGRIELDANADLDDDDGAGPADAGGEAGPSDAGSVTDVPAALHDSNAALTPPGRNLGDGSAEDDPDRADGSGTAGSDVAAGAVPTDVDSPDGRLGTGDDGEDATAREEMPWPTAFSPIAPVYRADEVTGEIAVVGGEVDEGASREFESKLQAWVSGTHLGGPRHFRRNN